MHVCAIFQPLKFSAGVLRAQSPLAPAISKASDQSGSPSQCPRRHSTTAKPCANVREQVGENPNEISVPTATACAKISSNNQDSPQGAAVLKVLDPPLKKQTRSNRQTSVATKRCRNGTPTNHHRKRSNSSPACCLPPVLPTAVFGLQESSRLGVQPKTTAQTSSTKVRQPWRQCR